MNRERLITLRNALKHYEPTLNMRSISKCAWQFACSNRLWPDIKLEGVFDTPEFFELAKNTAQNLFIFNTDAVNTYSNGGRGSWQEVVERIDALLEETKPEVTTPTKLPSFAVLENEGTMVFIGFDQNNLAAVTTQFSKAFCTARAAQAHENYIQAIKEVRTGGALALYPAKQIVDWLKEHAVIETTPRVVGWR